MFRILLAFFVTFTCSLSFACENFQLPPEYQDYFKNRELRYKQPVGKIAFVGDSKDQIKYDMLLLPKNRDVEKFVPSGTPTCGVAADFNGDGKQDFAGLYIYEGPEKRHNDWVLDLVIVYSEDGSTKHVVFPFTGQYVESQESVLVYLRRQGPGLVDLMPGQFALDNAGIGVYRRGRPASTYYWDGKGFVELAMGVDD